MKKIPIDGSHQKELSSDAEDFYSDYWISEVGISEESLRRHQEMLGYVFSEPPRSLKIAEIGIGAEGGVLLLLKEANDVFGLDVSSVAVEMCKRRGIHAALYNGDNERLPFEDNSIDVLFACEVFEHFANPQHALEEVRRTLKPGGIFALSIPNPFIHHWPRLFYPTLIDREPFREFLMVNRFKILKEVGIGSNHYRSTTLSDEDVWSWFWVCQNSKNGDSRGLFHSGQYFFQKRAPLGVRKFPIEAADLFRGAWEEDRENVEAAYALALALVYRVVNGERGEFLNLLTLLTSHAKDSANPNFVVAQRYLKQIESELSLFGLTLPPL